MNRIFYNRFFYRPVLILLLILCTMQARATHIIGADLYYTNISGLQYRVTLVLYGDCAGASFPTLPSSQPQITVYNNTSFFQSMTLLIQAPTNGLEVTPVCPSEVNNTQCISTSNPIPGIKKFVYTQTVTLNATSTNWRFRYDGQNGSSSSGRSGAITNIVNASSSIMALEATLNNTVGVNSSPVLSTIPTPFFCINKPASYNPGAVDANGDVLSFALIDALEAPSGTVNYVGGYSGSNPLAVQAGTFSFNNTNGQLNFTPNILQVSDVANKISEYRNGILVGTCMREMNFYVRACNNNPPDGIIGNSNGGLILNNTSVQACPSQGLFYFTIQPVDPDNNNINVIWAGVPSGAVLSVIGNGTTTPIITFSWNIASATPGTYTVYITYQDDGCPLSSKQTIAYTIIILPTPGIQFTLTSAATCTKKAVFNVTPSLTSPWDVYFAQGSVNFISRIGITGTITDSLAPGTYILSLINANGCEKDTSITINPPPPIPVTVNITNPVCYGGSNGSIAVSVTNVAPPYQYALDGGAYSSTSTFNSLSANSYTLHIKDGNDCIKDTTVNVQNPNPILFTVSTTKPPCNHFQNGSFTISAYNSVAPYQYAFGAGAYSSTNTFSNLYSGTYAVHIKNNLGCVLDTSVALPDSVKIQGTANVINVQCNGDANGAVTINANGAYPPYTYAIGSGSFGSGNVFSNLTAGTYTFHVLDIDLCYFDTTITINEPAVLNGTTTVVNVLCNGANTGSITVNATGGITTYNYNLNGGAYGSSNVFSGLNAGTYNIGIKDAHNCLKALNNIIIAEPAAIAATASITIPLCFGSSDGSVTLGASGGISGYTYANGAGSYGASNVFNGLAAGTYTFHIKDANACIKDTALTIINPPAIVPTVTLTPPACTGGTNGSIGITATGGAPGYTFAIGAGVYSASGNFPNLSQGVYTLHVKDQHLCIKDTTVTLDDAPPIHANVTLTLPPCNFFQNGSMTIAAFNSIAPYQYALGAGAYGASGTFNNLYSGNYTLHIKNSLGCIKDTIITLPDSVKVLGSAIVTNVLCNADATGSVSLGASGAFPGYTYAIGAGAFGSANLFNNLTAGTYTFHIHDTQQCFFDTTITITEPLVITITPVITNVLCNGGNTGVITVNAAGGVSPYNYALDANPYGATNSFNSLGAGTYTIHVKDANNCEKTTSAVISQTSVVAITVTIDSVLCNAGASGIVTINASGGITPYTYANGVGPYGASNIFNGLTAGNYNLHIKDGNNCVKDTTVTINQPLPIIPFAIVKKSTCSTLANGSVTLSATGGVPNYTYANGISAYSSSGVFSPLAAGTYTFHIKDNKACIKDTVITVSDSIVVHSTVTTTDASCNGYTDGSFTVTPNSGTSPYTYAVGVGAYGSSNIFNSLAAGSYNLHIKDNNGCIKDTAINITQPTIIIPSVTLFPPSCHGGTNGNISLTASGGTNPYTYALGAGVFGASGIFTNVTAGSYALHVKDNHNCTHDTTVNLTEPAAIAISLTVTNNKCFGDNSGTVLINAAGGTPGYTYAHDAQPYQAASLLTGFTAGIHAVHIKDQNGCIKDTVASLTQPEQLYLHVAIQNPTCEGYTDGIVVFTAVGGTGPYQYSDDNINFTSSAGFSNLLEGTYTYHIKDANGCTSDTTVTLTGYPHIVFANVDIKDESCFEFKDASISFNVIGGNPPFTYQVINPLGPVQSANHFDTLAVKTYTIQIKDSKGCKKDTTISITEPQKLKVETVITPNDCEGYDKEGGVRANVTGGTMPYKYLWTTSSAETSFEIKGMPNGKYAVFVTDANNCRDSISAIVAYDNCCKPFIPNAFTPNGDGKNDIFRVVFKGDMKLQEFSIFNRFGERVFITSSISQGWDGTYHGQLQNLGTYFYYIKALCGNKENNSVEFKGDVELIR